MLAAGPFTTTDNLLFEPLTELLAYARRKMPQLLILVGILLSILSSDIFVYVIEIIEVLFIY